MVKNLFKSIFLSFFIINQIVFLLGFVRGKLIGSKSLAVCHIRDIIKGYIESFLSWFSYISQFRDFLISEVKSVFHFLFIKINNFVHITNSNSLLNFQVKLIENFFVLFCFIMSIIILRFIFTKFPVLKSSKILTPNLFVYYPTSTAINSVFIRFMGIIGVFLLIFFFFFFNLNFVSLFIIDSFCLVLCWSVLYHFLYAFDHNVTQSEKNFNFDVSEFVILSLIGIIKVILLTIYQIFNHFTKNIKITFNSKHFFFGFNSSKPL